MSGNLALRIYGMILQYTSINLTYFKDEDCGTSLRFIQDYATREILWQQNQIF